VAVIGGVDYAATRAAGDFIVDPPVHRQDGEIASEKTGRESMSNSFLNWPWIRSPVLPK